MKLPKIFNLRLRLVQQGYELGYKHGIEAGKVEKHNEIISMLTYNLDNIDWTREEPIQVRDIVPMVKNHKPKIDEDVWT
jgi:flagellar biosynthesis/type III secretory pathway protein FliH